MKTNNRNVSIGGLLVAFSVILNGVVLSWSFTTNSEWYWALSITIPLFFITLINAAGEGEPPHNIDRTRRNLRMQKKTKPGNLKTPARLKKTERSFELNNLN